MSKLPSHLQVFEGSLYDNRKQGVTEPLRTNYAQSHREIKSVADLKACLRAGPYAWPGGYSIVYYTSDGALLCSDCAKKNFRSVCWSIRNNCSDGWKIVSSGFEATSAEHVKEYNTEHSEESQIDINQCDHCAAEFGELSC